jgi:hypothetical protein
MIDDRGIPSDVPDASVSPNAESAALGPGGHRPARWVMHDHPARTPVPAERSRLQHHPQRTASRHTRLINPVTGLGLSFVDPLNQRSRINTSLDGRS